MKKPTDELVMELNREDIKAFEEKVLMSGLCDFTVPVTVMSVNGKKQIIYHLEGYIAVCFLDMKGAGKAFEIVEKTLWALGRSREFLIDPGKVTLTCETVFYNRRKKDIRIAYVPVAVPKYRVVNSITGFMEEVATMSEGESRRYLMTAKEKIEKEGMSLDSALEYVRDFRRELALHGVR